MSWPNTREDIENVSVPTLIQYLNEAYRERDRSLEESAALARSLQVWRLQTEDAGRRIALIQAVLKGRL